jgi:ATPase subunit of ABC transporter with duplicated ATPase domains
MISVSSLSKSFGDVTLFEDVSFQLNTGDRYGLVGANGSGKTTLLNIIAGHEPASDGTVSVPTRAQLGVLRQDQSLYDEEEILGVTLRGNPELWEAMVAKQELLANASEHFDAAEILEGLGIPAELHRNPLSVLSGGFKLRVLLAQTLAGSPDALLLDEPTNHLDILSIRWLEKFLRSFSGPVLVISHDHRFLDNVATHILDVDYRTITLYHGSYSAFTQAKALERERREKEIETREKEIAHHRKFVDRFRAKASKARQAQSKLRLIEKKAEELVPLPPSSRRYPTFRFRQQRASGREVLELEAIRKRYGSHQVLHGVDLRVRRGDRLAIIGPNGIGKSTLLRIAVGQVEADAGAVKWGHAATPGYFDQDHHEQIGAESGTVEQWLAGHFPGASRSQVRGALGLVLFSGDDAEKPVTALSGGEATRLVFARLAMERPNVLVLDEPTNHLDLEAIEALVDGLQTYDGTLILVSHDRWFVSRLADRIIEINADGIRDYPGTYEEYVHSLGDDHLDADVVLERAHTGKQERTAAEDGEPSGSDHPAGATGRGSDGEADTASDSTNPYRLRERRDELTARIDEVESRLSEIETAFTDPDLYSSDRAHEVRDLQQERDQLRSGLEGLMAEWERVELALEERSP